MNCEGTNQWRILAKRLSACVCLQEEIETQKQQHEARVMSIRTEEKQKMDKMGDDLDQRWRDALR